MLELSIDEVPTSAAGVEVVVDIVHERVAGLDVHKAMIVACVRIVAGSKVKRECRTFETTTSDLVALLSWLSEHGCSQVAMEATGLYWKPVWNILSDGSLELIVANAAHIRNVPGRKTDMNDAMWIADLVACGLIKASVVPDEKTQDLRSLLRARKQLTREQTSHVQRIQKTLEEANIKLDSVISEIMGVSGRRMIEAMIAGVRNPAKLVALADRRIKASPKALYDALHGRLTDHRRFLVRPLRLALCRRHAAGDRPIGARPVYRLGEVGGDLLGRERPGEHRADRRCMRQWEVAGGDHLGHPVSGIVTASGVHCAVPSSLSWGTSRKVTLGNDTLIIRAPDSARPLGRPVTDFTRLTTTGCMGISGRAQ